MKKLLVSLVALVAAALCLAWAKNASAEPCEHVLGQLKAAKAQLESNTICVDQAKLRFQVDGLVAAGEACVKDLQACAKSKAECEATLKQFQKGLEDVAVWIQKNCSGALQAAGVPVPLCESLCRQSGGDWKDDKCSCPGGKELRGKCQCAPAGTAKRVPEPAKPVPTPQLPPPPPPPQKDCNADYDGDGVPNCKDNCVAVKNPGQLPSQKYPGLGEACEDMMAEEIQTRFRLVEKWVLEIDAELKKQGLDGKTAVSLLAWLKEHKENLATKAELAAAVKKLNKKVADVTVSVAAGFNCANLHKLPSYEWNEDNSLVLVSACVKDPYWEDFLAEQQCLAKQNSVPQWGVRYYWLPELDQSGVPTGKGECRENRDLVVLQGRLDSVAARVNEALKKASEALEKVEEQSRSFAYPIVGGFYQHYSGADRYAAGAEVGVRLPFGSEHYSLELLGRGGPRTGTGQTDVWGGAVRFHLTPGDPKDPVRFDLGVGPSIMNWTKLSSGTSPTTHRAIGLEVQPGVAIRLNQKCGFRFGVPIGTNSYWGSGQKSGFSVGASADFSCSFQW